MESSNQRYQSFNLNVPKETLKNCTEKPREDPSLNNSLKRPLNQMYDLNSNLIHEYSENITKDSLKRKFNDFDTEKESDNNDSEKLVFSNQFENLVNKQQDLQQIRNSLFEICGFNFPFEYNPENAKFEMIMKPYQKVLLSDSTKSIKKIFLEVGKYCFHQNNILCCIKKVKKDTSQGVVYVLEHRNTPKSTSDKKGTLNDKKGTFIVLKTDKISKENNIWHDPEKQDTILIFGENNSNKYKMIGAGYMDAFCCQFLSNIVEEEKLPHFPLVYGTTINQYGKDFFQMLWMEYLPFSLFDVLQKEPDIRVWLSCLFQITFTLAYVQHHFGFHHNDFHADNIRIRKIDKKESANYKIVTSDEVIIESNIQYYGILCCIIDCGRSLIKPWGIKKVGLISSEFSNEGNCGGLIPDNNSFDMIRLLSCLHSMSNVIKPEKDKIRFQEFVTQFCKTDQKDNYLEGFNKFSTSEFRKLPDRQKKVEQYDYIEKFPRMNCHKAQPLKILKSMNNLFKPIQNSVPNFILEI